MCARVCESAQRSEYIRVLILAFHLFDPGPLCCSSLGMTGYPALSLQGFSCVCFAVGTLALQTLATEFTQPTPGSGGSDPVPKCLPTELHVQPSKPCLF